MGTYHVHETTFFRALSRLIPLLILLFFQGGVKHVFRTEEKGRHFIRLLINLGYTYAFMLSFSLTSLTTVYAVSYTSSFFMVIFGALFLKEKVSRKKWIAVAVGMAGVLVALRPGIELFQTGAILVLVGTWLGALNKIFMRKLAATEHTLAITIYPNLLMLIVAAPFLLKNWAPLTLVDAGLFAAVGILTAGAQYSVAQALRFAKASTLGPIDYSSFVWVISLDLFFWEITPSAFTLIGSVIIIGSNLYLLYWTKAEEGKKTVSSEISAP